MPLKSPPRKSAKRSVVEMMLDMQLELFHVKQLLKDAGISLPDPAGFGVNAGDELEESPHEKA